MEFREPNNEKKVDLRTTSGKETKDAELEKREQFLRSLEFSDLYINELRKKRPALFDSINGQEIVDFLKSIGLTNPQKMIVTLSAVLRYNINNIKQKITDLEVLGFPNPQKMIISMPSILGLNIESIKRKIEDLKSLGFSNPIRMITSFPTILGLSIENIKRKINTLGSIFKLYGLEIDINQLIEKRLQLLASKIDKIWIIARMLRTLNFDPIKITEDFLSKLTLANITDTTMVVSLLNKQGRRNWTRGQVIEAIREAKNIPQNEKEKIISLNGNSKLSIRYKRGYSTEVNSSDLN